MSEQIPLYGGAVATASTDRDWITIVIPGEPQAQQRARATGFKDKAGKFHARVYDPTESRNWKATAREHMRLALGDRQPLDGPVELELIAYFTCPRSEWRKTQPRLARFHAKKPDLDNILKASKDSAKGVLWFDDSQVARAVVTKIIAAQGEAPKVVIMVRELAPFVGRSLGPSTAAPC